MTRDGGTRFPLGTGPGHYRCVKSMEEWGHAADWTPEQIAEWKRRYENDEPLLLPHAEHEEGECDHCDLLRRWMREVHHP